LPGAVTRKALALETVKRRLLTRLAANDDRRIRSWNTVLAAGFLTMPCWSEHFELVLVAIVLISVLPMGIELVLSRRRRAFQKPMPVEVE
jgi:hypothetical protein